MITLDDPMDAILSNLPTLDQNRSGISGKDLIPLIDLTLLDNEATPQSIKDLATKASDNNVAAICVYPKHLDCIPSDLHLKRATVINFPQGNEPQLQLLKTMERILADHKVDEIDYVFSYQDYLAGNQETSITHCHEVYQLCQQHDLIFKVILETGALPSNQIIYDISTKIIKNGCDFLKTSTGKIAHGATLPAVFSMLKAIIDTQSTCGIKVSGGVKTPESALHYAVLAQQMLNRPLNNSWFRIGASSLLDELMLYTPNIPKY